MAKILCVLYDDPVDGYPKSYARDDIPHITSYPGGQTAPTPHALGFTPGQLLGSVSGGLGLRRFLMDAGHLTMSTCRPPARPGSPSRKLPAPTASASPSTW
jgi:formate dehydrogenase